MIIYVKNQTKRELEDKFVKMKNYINYLTDTKNQLQNELFFTQRELERRIKEIKQLNKAIKKIKGVEKDVF